MPWQGPSKEPQVTPEQTRPSLTGYNPTGPNLGEQSWRFETGSINSLWHGKEKNHVQGLARDSMGNKAVLWVLGPSRRQGWSPATYNTYPSSSQETRPGSQAETDTTTTQPRQEVGMLVWAERGFLGQWAEGVGRLRWGWSALFRAHRALMVAAECLALLWLTRAWAAMCMFFS